MDDLISRKAVLDYLRNDFGFRFPFYDGTRLGTSQLLVTVNDVISAIQHNVPAVDAVPVVRCKECRHWGTGYGGETDKIKVCEWANYMVGGNGYCVYGERRYNGKAESQDR